MLSSASGGGQTLGKKIIKKEEIVPFTFFFLISLKRIGLV